MSSERHRPRIIQQIKEIQATVTESGYRRLQTDAEKVRYLKKLGFSLTSITKTTRMKKRNLKRYFSNPKATNVSGNPSLTTEEEHLLVGVILTREQDSLSRDKIRAAAWEIASYRELEDRSLE